MKKIIILSLLFILIPNNSFATEQIINDQLEALNISSFIKESEKYTEETFPDLNVQELITRKPFRTS